MASSLYNYTITYIKNSKTEKIDIWATDEKALKSHMRYPKNIINIQVKNRFQPMKLKKSIKNIDEIIDNLDLLLRANIKIDEAIALLQDRYKSGTNEHIFLSEFLTHLQKGDNISAVFQNTRYHINQDIVSFMKLADSADNIANIVSNLNTILKKSKDIRETIQAKFRYPIMLAFMLVVSAVFLFVVVLPKFSYIFSVFGENLPYITVLFLKLKTHFLSVFGLGVGMCVVVVSSYKLARVRHIKFRILTDKIKLFHIGFISKILYQIEIYKLFLSLLSVLKANYNFTTALQIAKETMTNSYILSRLDNMLAGLEKGDSIYDLFESSKLFEPFVYRLVGFSQLNRDIDETIGKISFIYENRLSKNIDNLSAVIEPVLIIVIGLFVLFMMLAIFLPVWELGTIIR